MARTFTKNLANYGVLGTNVVGPNIGAAPAISCYARHYIRSLTGTGTDNRLIHILISGTTLNALTLGWVNTAPRIAGRSVSTDGLASVTSGTIPTLNAWHTTGGILDFANNLAKIYVDGVLDTTTTAIGFGSTTYSHGVPTSPDAVGGDNAPPSTTTRQVDGDITEVAIWNVALTDAEFARLHAGESAILVKPQNLVFRMWLKGAAPETDPIHGLTLTITGSLPVVADAYPFTPEHIRPKISIFYPQPRARNLRRFVWSRLWRPAQGPPVLVRRPRIIHFSRNQRPVGTYGRGLVRGQFLRRPLPRTAKTGNKLLAPFNNVETVRDHFVSRGWRTVRDQINAGFPYYAQPVPDSGRYVETIDYGAVFNNTIINLDWATQIVAGTVNVQSTIETSLDGIAWSTPIVGQSAFGVSFRFVRVTIDFTPVN